ncbi:MAG: 30S ribosomal protein S21 [bacterium]|nr:30S ribosomal protein S21 [bacterium]
MLEVRRKKGEHFDALLRRFKRRVQQSGTLIQAKKIRFHDGASSKTAKKKSALHRISIAEKREYLSKIGKLPVEERPRRSWK